MGRKVNLLDFCELVFFSINGPKWLTLCRIACAQFSQPSAMGSCGFVEVQHELGP